MVDGRDCLGGSGQLVIDVNIDLAASQHLPDLFADAVLQAQKSARQFNRDIGITMVHRLDFHGDGYIILPCFALAVTGHAFQ